MAQYENSSHDRQNAYCIHSFPTIWSSFIHAFIDTIHANGPSSPRQHHDPPPPPTILPKTDRLIAIGDLHGDLTKARRAFRLAGLIDHKDSWIGGSTVAVQVGDILDRGDEEIELFYWLERLQKEAALSGGALHVLNGNHETMNVAQQFRYATPGGFDSFRRYAESHALENSLLQRCGCRTAHEFRASMGLNRPTGVEARTEALQPGGPIARRFIASHPVVLQVGSTVFVHGGLLPSHVKDGMEVLNREVHEWVLRGPIERKPAFLSGRDAVVWSRHYSLEDGQRCHCGLLEETLNKIPGARRMVVGHTIQENGINSACNGKVYRIDVGLSKGCGDGLPEVLEILKDDRIRRVQEQQTSMRKGTGGPSGGGMSV